MRNYIKLNKRRRRYADIHVIFVAIKYKIKNKKKDILFSITNELDEGSTVYSFFLHFLSI